MKHIILQGCPKAESGDTSSGRGHRRELRGCTGLVRAQDKVSDGKVSRRSSKLRISRGGFLRAELSSIGSPRVLRTDSSVPGQGPEAAGQATTPSLPWKLKRRTGKRGREAGEGRTRACTAHREEANRVSVGVDRSTRKHCDSLSLTGSRSGVTCRLRRGLLFTCAHILAASSRQQTRLAATDNVQAALDLHEREKQLRLSESFLQHPDFPRCSYHAFSGRSTRDHMLVRRERMLKGSGGSGTWGQISWLSLEKNGPTAGKRA